MVLGLGGDGGEDALYDQAVAIVAKDRKCSTSYIQRKLGIGYNKAAQTGGADGGTRRRHPGQPRRQTRDPCARSLSDGTKLTDPARNREAVATDIPVAAALAYKGVMNRRTLILAPLMLAALGTPALADKLSLKTLSGYLNGLTTVESEFTQVNSDGTVSTGKLFIQRPGRVRFEYNPPDKTLVLAGGQQVAIFDGKSNAPPEQYPLKRTPLNLILAKNINLGKAKMVVGHSADATTHARQGPRPRAPRIRHD